MSPQVPHSQVESWLFALPEWKSRLETLESQQERIPGLTQKFELVAIHGKGQKNEAILNEVIRRLQVQEIEIPVLQMKIQMLEAAIQALLPKEQQFIEHRYLLRLPHADVMEKLKTTHRIYYRNRKRVLSHIYRFVGGPDSILGMEDDMISSE